MARLTVKYLKDLLRRANVGAIRIHSDRDCPLGNRFNRGNRCECGIAELEEEIEAVLSQEDTDR